jgi:hypothetical protein
MANMKSPYVLWLHSTTDMTGTTARNDMDSETIWYEYAPYLYAIAGLVSISQIGSVMGISCGLLLLGSACLILVLRWNYRSSQKDKSTLKHGAGRLPSH